MLFVIDESVVQALASSPDEETIEAVENIALARRKGKHLLFASRETLEYLKNYENIDVKARSLFGILHKRLPQLGNLRGSFTRCVEVVSSDFPASIKQKGQVKILQIPAKMLSDFTSLDKPTLLCENGRDCEFYSIVAEVYLLQTNLKNIKIEYIKRGGGGSTISEEYQAMREEKRFCLCIVDSDKKFPGDAIGGTARKVKHIDKKEDTPFCECFITGSREVENIIPTQILSEIASEKMKSIGLLEVLETSSMANSREYIDIKNGLKLGDIVANGHKEYGQYWSNVLEEIAIMIQVGRECHHTQQCSNKQDCRCIIMEGLGSNILDRTLGGFMRRRNNHKLAEITRGRYISADWEKIGQLVSAWCCAGSPIRL